MIRKIITENNEQLENRYLSVIADRLKYNIKKDGSIIYFSDEDYKKVKETVQDVKGILSEMDFKLDFVDYNEEESKSVYEYVKNEFGYNINITVILDESDWETPVCKVSVVVNDTITETYDPRWVERANEDDLVSLRSELETFDMNAEKIYDAVKNSEDRNNKSELDSLVSQLKNINKDLEKIAKSWSDAVTESLNDLDNSDEWTIVKTKSVQDSDGFYTDYTLWYNNKTKTWECIFGDNELYNPHNEYADAEFEDEKEAREWFDNYTGFKDDDDLHFYESSI